VDVAVFVTMQLVRNIADFAARARIQGAAGSGCGLAPESAGLVVAAASAPRRSATFLALAFRISHLLLSGDSDPRNAAVLKLKGGIGLGPGTPADSVVTSNSADEGISRFQHERRFLEVLHVNSPDR